MLIKIQDSTTSKRLKDDNGYLIVKNNPIAKAGVFQYLLSELKQGINEADDRVVNVYRPFKDLCENKDTFAKKPIKMNHHWVGEEVNVVDGSISETISVDENNLMLRADLIIYNPELIELIEKGELVELSPAYTGEEEEVSGRFNGEDYEFIQRIVSVNHLAVVDKGRSGRDLRIEDSEKKIQEFQMKRKFKDSFLKHIKKFFDEDEVANKDKQDDDNSSDVKNDDEIDRRDIIRQIMELSSKSNDDFEGGEDEKIETIAKLAEKLAYDQNEDEEPSKDDKQDEDEPKKEDEGDDEIKKEDDEGDDEIKPEELAEAVAEVTEAIVEKKLNEYADKQRVELKKINDTYAKVSEALGTSFDYRGMDKDDIYRFGYEALTNQSLDKGMHPATAFLLASKSKKSSLGKFNDSAASSKKSGILDILSKKY